MKVSNVMFRNPMNKEVQMLDTYGNTIRQKDQVLTVDDLGEVTDFDFPTGRVMVLTEFGESWYNADDVTV